MVATESHWSRALTRIERAAHDATSADDLTETVGRLFAEAVEADAYVFLRLDPLTALWLGASGAGYDRQACERFNTKIFLRSPHADYGRATRDEHKVSRLAPRDLDDADPTRRYYFDDLGMAEDLRALFSVGGQGFGHLTLGRRSGTFAPGAVKLVEASLAPVTAALRRLLARETLESAPGDSVGLLFVDAEGSVTPANALGQALLARCHALDPWQTRTALAALIEIARRDLHEPTGRPLPRVVYVEPQTQKRYRLVPERMMISPGARPQALIMAEPIRALDSVELLRNSGLSEREAEVAMMTLRGFKSGEAAEALRISEHTLLSHLKSVYRKLGVTSRGELASLILSGV